MLACPRLKAMFTGEWEEATKIRSDGLRHWDLGDHLDPDAFVIVMNIIHGRNRSVPQKVDLEMLAKICVIIDDLQCHEATEMFARVWLMEFGGKTPSTYCRDLILWVFVASVLCELDIFRITTRTAMLSSAQEIRSLGLPIRLDIVGRPSRLPLSPCDALTYRRTDGRGPKKYAQRHDSLPPQNRRQALSGCAEV